MFLSRMRLSREATSDPELGRRWENLYRLHQEVWSLFTDGPGRQRDFLYRFDQEGREPRIFCLSARAPRKSQGVFRVEYQRFAADFAVGERLRFSLRANPVVNRQGARHDVVMDAWCELKRRGVPRSEMPSMQEVARERGAAWLVQKAAKHGFAVAPGEFAVERYGPLELTKPNGTRVSLGICDFSGTLTVTDPEAFRSTLQGGIGPAKGFGCGLLLCGDPDGLGA